MGPRQTRWTFSARRPDRVQARWQFGRRVPTIEDLEAQSHAFPMEYSTALPTIRKRGSRAPNNPSSFLAQVEGWHQRRRVGDSSTSRPLAQGPSAKGVSFLLGLLIWNACNSTSIKLWDMGPAYPSTALQVLWGAALLRQPRCRRSPPPGRRFYHYHPCCGFRVLGGGGAAFRGVAAASGGTIQASLPLRRPLRTNAYESKPATPPTAQPAYLLFEGGCSREPLASEPSSLGS